MAKKRHTPEQIINKLREAEVLLSKGMEMPKIFRKLAVSEQTYYRWRKEYGGVRSDQAKRLKEFEKENVRLEKFVAELSLDKQMLEEIARESSEPVEAATGCRTSPGSLRSLRETRLSCGAAAAVDAAKDTKAAGRRATTGSTFDGFGDAVRSIRIPTDYRSAWSGRLAGEPQAGRETLATRGPQGASETAEETTTMAQWRIRCSFSPEAPGSRVERRFRPRP